MCQSFRTTAAQYDADSGPTRLNAIDACNARLRASRRGSQQERGRTGERAGGGVAFRGVYGKRTSVFASGTSPLRVTGADR